MEEARFPDSARIISATVVGRADKSKSWRAARTTLGRKVLNLPFRIEANFWRRWLSLTSQKARLEPCLEERRKMEQRSAGSWHLGGGGCETRIEREREKTAEN